MRTAYLLTLATPGEPARRRTVGEPQLVAILDDLHRGGLPADASLSVTALASARRAGAAG